MNGFRHNGFSCLDYECKEMRCRAIFRVIEPRAGTPLQFATNFIVNAKAPSKACLRFVSAATTRSQRFGPIAASVNPENRRSQPCQDIRAAPNITKLLNALALPGAAEYRREIKVFRAPIRRLYRRVAVDIYLTVARNGLR
jgi:hypothetical protein